MFLFIDFNSIPSDREGQEEVKTRTTGYGRAQNVHTALFFCRSARNSQATSARESRPVSGRTRARRLRNRLRDNNTTELGMVDVTFENYRIVVIMTIFFSAPTYKRL